MIVTTIKTRKVMPNELSIHELLDESLPTIKGASIVAITSKVVSLCEGRVVPIGSVDKAELIKQESDYYLPGEVSKHGYHFTIADKTLTSLGGVDESNGAGNYVLWPRDSQKTANELRLYLKKRFGLKRIGLVITDSTFMPMRWGAVGLALGFSGFKPLRNYIGQPDLFDRPFKVSQTGVAGGLAAAAVLVMGEGPEQTPLAVIQDVGFVDFVDRNPTEEELKRFKLERYEDDLFAPFLNSLKWQKGQRKK
jgi:dihydrofolate synthase / folylpolyglutamate synthase